MKLNWPKDLTIWEETSQGQIIRRCMSVPFTWLLPKAKRFIESFPGVWIVGGPAVQLMPDYLAGVAQVGREYPGVLQRVNPMATRTTVGCPNRCIFCGIRRISGNQFRELDDWPDLPIVCDDNLMAASREHFEKVCFRLQQHGWCDFNQGLDCRLLTPWHALRIQRIGKPIVRMALDDDETKDRWATAMDYLLTAGIPKSRIRSYVLIGRGTPENDWKRCGYVESFGVKALPMWYHSLRGMYYGEILPCQQTNGWSKDEQRRIMRYYYQHSGRERQRQTARMILEQSGSPTVETPRKPVNNSQYDLF